MQQISTRPSAVSARASSRSVLLTHSKSCCLKPAPAALMAALSLNDVHKRVGTCFIAHPSTERASNVACASSSAMAAPMPDAESQGEVPCLWMARGSSWPLPECANYFLLPRRIASPDYIPQLITARQCLKRWAFPQEWSLAIGAVIR